MDVIGLFWNLPIVCLAAISFVYLYGIPSYLAKTKGEQEQTLPSNTELKPPIIYGKNKEAESIEMIEIIKLN